MLDYKSVGEICLEKGLITGDQLEKAIQYQQESRITLGVCLVKLNFISNAQLIEVLREQKRIISENLNPNNKNKLQESEIIDKNIPILKIPITLVDLIVTGISPDAGGEIAQIGVLNLYGNEIQDKFIADIKTENELSKSFKILYKINEETLSNGKHFSQIAPKIISIIGNRPIVAFNLQMIMNFINFTLKKYNFPIIFNDFIDLLTLWRKLHPGTGYKSFIQMCQLYNYNLERPYDINDSIVALKYIYFKIIKEMEKEQNIVTISEIIEFQNRKFLFISPEKNEIYYMIKKSIGEKRRIEINYYSKWSDKANIRKIDPYKIINQGNNYYIIAFCHLRNSVRWFRLDRIKRIDLLNENYKKIEDYDENSNLK